jgi:hypothetical protein
MQDVLVVVGKDYADGLEVIETYFDDETNGWWAIAVDGNGTKITWAV